MAGKKTVTINENVLAIGLRLEQLSLWEYFRKPNALLCNTSINVCYKKTEYSVICKKDMNHICPANL